MTSEPRQWAIRLCALIINDFTTRKHQELPSDLVHVIEYSAYEAMKAERDEWKEAAYKLSLERHRQSAMEKK